MLIKKRKNTVPPWKIFILTVVGFGLMLAIAVHSRNEALNRLSQEYTITDDAKPRHIKFESMPVGEAEQAVVHGFKTFSEEEYGDEKSQYDNHATLLGYTSYKVVQVSLDEQWPDETKENITRQYAVGRSRKSWKIFEITEK